MKTNFKLLWLMAIAVCFLGVNVQGQTGVLNPNDPIVVYNPASPPAIPAANTMVKWVKTNRLNWNTSSFKCYFYNNTAFRLKFPKTYVPGNGKKYPVYIFFHGVGERGTIYDNEYQLYHGGQVHSNAVDNGSFDGYLLYIQSSTSSGSFGDPYYQVVYDIVTKYLIPEYQADENRIIV
ncbi:MAG: hypothetical protein JSU05_14420, partial [Bacteroidetes bacterium]|nr:hypothetical protein [Bacteroidota bacterium]